MRLSFVGSMGIPKIRDDFNPVCFSFGINRIALIIFGDFPVSNFDAIISGRAYQRVSVEVT